jgi:peptidoglycan/LPS O-acetylase OafA/YrhL
MKNLAEATQRAERIHAFDWLRVITCGVVILIHTVHMFGELYRTPSNISFSLDDGPAYGISFLTQWCMALFFLLAGASTWLALRHKTPWQFIQERISRLLLPLVIGFVLLVPLQTYFELVSNEQYSGTLISFYPYFLGGILFGGKLHWIVSSIHHLWFLAYLFGYSLLTLPLCLFLRSEVGQRWIAKLTRVCEHPCGLLLLALPVILLQVTLRALFPIYCSLTDALCWMLFYIYGYILLASPQLRQALHEQVKIAAGLSVASIIGFLLVWSLGPLHQWMYTPDYSYGCLFFQILFSLALWSFTILTLAISSKYLNRTGPMLAYSSTASFSWYLIHFPIVIIIAYMVIPLQFNVLIAFFLIGGGAFMLTLILSDLIFLKMVVTQALLQAGYPLWYTLEKMLKTISFSLKSPPPSRTITGGLDAF